MTREPLSRHELALMVLRLSHYLNEGPLDEAQYDELRVDAETMALRILDEERHPEPPLVRVDVDKDCPY